MQAIERDWQSESFLHPQVLADICTVQKATTSLCISHSTKGDRTIEVCKVANNR